MKILVIQQKMIGDVLTSSILFEALRELFPNAELHYLVESYTVPVLQNNPFIDRLILVEPIRFRDPKYLWFFLKKMRGEKYEVIIDVYSKISTGFLSLWSGAKKRISYAKWYTSYFYTDTLIPHKANPETTAGLAIENRINLLKVLTESNFSPIRPKIYLSESERELAKQKLKKANLEFDKPIVMSGVLGSTPAKTYPLVFMAQVLDYIAINFNAQILFNFTPSQRTEAMRIFDLCSSQTRSKIFFEVSGRTLREYLSITSHCHAFVGNEGGAANMAKALNIPTFSIFSPEVKKEAWNCFEDGKQIITHHLKDYRADLFMNGRNTRSYKDIYEMYLYFRPSYFLSNLNYFLSQHLPKS